MVSGSDFLCPWATNWPRPMCVCMCKCQLSMSCMVGEDPGGTLGAYALTRETWYSLLWFTSPAPGGIAGADSRYLSNAQVPQC